eukprot:Sspe_Gene.68329::Locus_40311_Transcript_2_2_Confidence_0.500_Length_1503::g.68329::m.68329
MHHNGGQATDRQPPNPKGRLYTSPVMLSGRYPTVYRHTDDGSWEVSIELPSAFKAVSASAPTKAEAEAKALEEACSRLRAKGCLGFGGALATPPQPPPPPLSKSHSLGVEALYGTDPEGMLGRSAVKLWPVAGGRPGYRERGKSKGLFQVDVPLKFGVTARGEGRTLKEAQKYAAYDVCRRTAAHKRASWSHLFPRNAEREGEGETDGGEGRDGTDLVALRATESEAMLVVKKKSNLKRESTLSVSSESRRVTFSDVLDVEGDGLQAAASPPHAPHRTCHTCGRLGHIASECSSTRGKEDSSIIQRLLRGDVSVIREEGLDDTPGGLFNITISHEPPPPLALSAKAPPEDTDPQKWVSANGNTFSSNTGGSVVQWLANRSYIDRGPTYV